MAAALSGGAALSLKGGTFVEYDIRVPTEGPWMLYTRKPVSSDAFRWRIDDGPWHDVLKFKFRGARLPSGFLKSDQDWIQRDEDEAGIP
jgi:hypothetical protein